jgi:hypothetical protein
MVVECGDSRFWSWMESLMIKLLSNYPKYFSKDGVLNSDGRRLFEEIVKPLIKECPELKGVVRKARKNPTLENVFRVAERFMDREALESIVKEALNPDIPGIR